mgnify:CR=1 FL=1
MINHTKIARADTLRMQKANCLAILLPIDPYGDMIWTPEQSTKPFIYGSSSKSRVRNLQQIAYRIARNTKF